MDIKLEFGAAIEAMTGQVDKMHKGFLDEWDKRNPRPRYFTVRGQSSSASSSTTPFQIDLGGPPIGFMWDVMGVVLAGTDDHTAVAGAVALYVGNNANISLTGLLTANFAIPSYTSVGKDRIWVQPATDLIANVSGVANSTLVTVGVHVAEWKQIDKIPSGAA